MQKAVELVLTKCLNVMQEDSVLIVTDAERYSLAMEFFYGVQNLTKGVKLVSIPIPEVNGTEPPRELADQMLKYTVLLLVTTKSLTHTKARKQACENGARAASMPGITEDMLQRTIDIDYDQLFDVNARLADIIDNGKKVRVTTKLGTEFEFSIENREAYGRDSGLYTKPGSFGNLPTGEVFVAPVEGTANGGYFVDASQAGVGKLSEPLAISVSEGFITEMKGQGAEELMGKINELGQDAANIAEFGIGTNEKATITGNILEDEKVKGTCHVAFGNNAGFGGNVNVPLHLDGIITKPTIEIDGKIIMKEGVFLI